MKLLKSLYSFNLPSLKPDSFSLSTHLSTSQETAYLPHHQALLARLARLGSPPRELSLLADLLRGGLDGLLEKCGVSASSREGGAKLRSPKCFVGVFCLVLCVLLFFFDLSWGWSHVLCFLGGWFSLVSSFGFTTLEGFKRLKLCEALETYRMSRFGAQVIKPCAFFPNFLGPSRPRCLAGDSSSGRAPWHSASDGEPLQWHMFFSIWRVPISKSSVCVM